MKSMYSNLDNLRDAVNCINEFFGLNIYGNIKHRAMLFDNMTKYQKYSVYAIEHKDTHYQEHSLSDNVNMTPEDIEMVKEYDKISSKILRIDRVMSVLSALETPITEKKLNKFDKTFLKVAKVVAELSKDPSAKIGAVITGKNRQILSQGYNGFPRGVDDCEERYLDKKVKYSLVVHAEANAIYNASANQAKLEGATIYVYGLPTCNECAKAIIQVGIKKVIQLNTKPDNDSWKESNQISRMMFKEAGVEVIDVLIEDL